jgi:hypothetical protein
MERSAELFDAAGERVGRASSVVAGVRCAVWAGAFGDQLDLDPLIEIARDGALPAEVRAEAQLVASEVAWMTGDAQSSLAWSASAADLAKSIGDHAMGAESLVSRATGHWLELDLHAALADLDRAVPWAEQAPVGSTLALVQGRRALTTFWLGDVGAAAEAISIGLEAAARANTPLERTLPLAARAALAAMQGDHATAMRATAESDLLCSLSGDYWAAAFTFPTAAASSCWHDDLDGARAQLDRWEATLDGTGSDSRRLLRLMIEVNRRYLAALAGDGGQRDWFEGLAPNRLVGRNEHANVGSATFFTLLAEASDRLDLPELAAAVLPYLDDAMARGQVMTSGWPALLPRVAAMAARVAGQADDASSRAASALEVAQRDGLVVEEVRARLELARGSGDAVDHRTRAESLAHEHGLGVLLEL